MWSTAEGRISPRTIVSLEAPVVDVSLTSFSAGLVSIDFFGFCLFWVCLVSILVRSVLCWSQFQCSDPIGTESKSGTLMGMRKRSGSVSTAFLGIWIYSFP